MQITKRTFQYPVSVVIDQRSH